MDIFVLLILIRRHLHQGTSRLLKKLTSHIPDHFGQFLAALDNPIFADILLRARYLYLRYSSAKKSQRFPNERMSSGLLSDSVILL